MVTFEAAAGNASRASTTRKTKYFAGCDIYTLRNCGNKLFGGTDLERIRYNRNVQLSPVSIKNDVRSRGGEGVPDSELHPSQRFSSSKGEEYRCSRRRPDERSNAGNSTSRSPAWHPR